MLVDYGSRDPVFTSMVREVEAGLLKVAGVDAGSSGVLHLPSARGAFYDSVGWRCC